MSFNSTKAELFHNNHQKLVNTAEDGVYTGKEAYQQSPDQASDVAGHAGSLGVTWCQLYQSYQEVLALLHTFQSLLSMENCLQPSPC